MRNLLSFCESLDIPSRELTTQEAENYRNSHPSSDLIIDSMIELDEIMNHQVILFGGLSAHPNLLGYRKMRRTSNDIDALTNEEGITHLHENFNGRLFVTKNYGDLFLDFDGIPCSFDVGETHDWTVPNDFYTTSRTFEFPNGQISTISPEYLIALKFRRSEIKGRMYGKDKFDMANLILAPLFKDIQDVNYDETALLIRQNSIPEIDKMMSWFSYLPQITDKLRKEEREPYIEQLNLFKESIDTVYSKTVIPV
jgi:hypothetical protein